MMSHPILVPLPGNEQLAASISGATGAEIGALELRDFPDGESYLRFACDVAGRSVILLCSLARPNNRILPLLFAADAARDLGAGEVGLVAPYLAYMRQDRRFNPGEAITSQSFARLLSGGFDWLVTVDPHLHRYPSLDAIYTIPARVVHAAPSTAHWIEANVKDPVIVGPDVESEQWVREVAELAGAPHFVLSKTRAGDRDVAVVLPDIAPYAGRNPVLVDDIGSSGQTLGAAACCLARAGLEPRYCIVVHALFDRSTAEIFGELPMRIVSTDTVPHASNGIALTSALATAIEQMRWNMSPRT